METVKSFGFNVLRDADVLQVCMLRSEVEVGDDFVTLRFEREAAEGFARLFIGNIGNAKDGRPSNGTN